LEPPRDRSRFIVQFTTTDDLASASSSSNRITSAL
jgi:hypothetical protein